MVDNFELIKPLLKFENEGDCYYVQLLRRQSDDPKIDGEPDPAYHGNMHSRSIKDYFIRSIEHLDRVADEIRTLCKIFNVRAYIRLNKRSYKAIALSMTKHVIDQMTSGETYSSPFNLIASAAGKANCAGSDKTWIVDIDKEYLPYRASIVEQITKCQPFQNAEDMHIIPTKNGEHVICKPFNVKSLQDWWLAQSYKMPLCDIHKDNPTILYVV